VAGGHVFTYARGRSGGEARLHSLRSVGVGGHVEPGAGPRVPMVAYVESLARELAEEVRLPGGGAIPVPPPAALLDDESTPVGRVHLGVLHVARLAVPDLEAAEDDLADPRFADLAGLAADPAGYEEWSRLALPVLAGLARTPPPAAGSGRDRNG
jgi:predicted NUDIX family phosphoesterase